MAQTMSGQWADSVPIGANGDGRPGARRQDSSDYGQSKPVRRPSDAWNIMSDSEETRMRRQSVKQSNSTAMKKRSRNTLRDKSQKEKPAERVDDSAWIHRDKLAQIEIQEMQDAGIDMSAYRRSQSVGPGASGRSSRSQSRSRRPSKDKTAEQITDEEYSAAYPPYEDFEPKRISTIPAADEEDQDFDPSRDTEFRTPEEVAMAEFGPARMNNVIRPSTSRIPVSKASPVPVPATVVDRDSPLPRSRGNSNAWSGNPNWDEMQYARKARSNSIGSQAMLDDDHTGIRTPPRPGSSNPGSSNENNNSPPKSRLPSKATPNSRKAPSPTDSSTISKPRTTSSTARDSNRPVSRGHQSRPSTARAPEGEAPWIATMYKPDPRLPPDQQMLPTHAKRMMQEMWEKEGRASSAYDRDLRPMGETQLPPAPASPTTNQALQPLTPSQLNSMAKELPADPNVRGTPALSPGLSSFRGSEPRSPSSVNGNAWPLTPKSETPSSRPGTSGGYKITPTISTPPAIQKSPTKEAPPTIGGAQAHNATPRVPATGFDDDKDDERGRKGGCGCCVVM